MDDRRAHLPASAGTSALHGAVGAGAAEIERPLITTRWATAADVESVYGFPLAVTVQAIVGLENGEPFALIGLARVEGQSVLFSEYKPGYKAHLRHPACLRAILKMAEVMRARGVPTIALADAGEPDSDRLLQRLGFEQIESTEDGGLYKWHS